MDFDSKLCVILTDGAIPELGNARGPITRPTRIPRNAVISIMNRGLNIQEVNPRNFNERVKLTFSNINSNNFLPKPKKPVVPPVQKLPEGRRNTVVVPPNEAAAVIHGKKEKKENKETREIPVKSSDF